MKPYYSDKWVTIYCADSREIVPLDGDSLLTDPPYGLNSKMQGGTWGTAYRRGDMLRWDYLVSKEDIYRLFDISQTQIIWGANNYEMPPSRCWLVWLKPLFPTMSDLELAWTNMDKPAKYYFANRMSQANHHPTEKPEGLICWCISLVDKADLILDPFLGSGTTAYCAKKLNRRCIGIEIEEKYCQIAAKRCCQEVMELKI